MVQALRGWRLSAAIFILHATVFLALTVWSWRKWLDPVIDSGRELYIPWAILRGHVLYRDIASLFGPLSPYVNALWFRLFGDSLLTLALCNLAIFALLTFAIYHIVRSATDRITATAAALSTLLLFGFSQYVGVGNYNFVTPYSHEATHGLALCIAVVLFLYRGIAEERRLFIALGGISFGMVLLTKPDTSIGAMAAVIPAWLGAWTLAVNDRARTRVLLDLPLFLVSAIVPPLLFLIYFATKMPLGPALRGVAGAFVTTLVPGITDNEFYRRVAGFDEPLLNTLRMVLIFAQMVIYFAILAAVCWPRGGQAGPPSLVKRLQQLAVLVIGVAFAVRGLSFFALPLICVAALFVLTPMFFNARETDRPEALKTLLLVMWSAMSLALLAKIVLAARVVHYGFYLSIPGTVTAIVLMCWTMPRLLTQRGATWGAPTFRAVSLCLLLATIVPYVRHSNGWYATRVLPIGFGTDRFWASNASVFSRGTAVQDALEYLQRTIQLRSIGRGPRSTIAVLPEGAMLNYQLRIDSPLRVINVMPPEIVAFGEDDVLHSLQAAPPSFIVHIYRDMKEYGYPPFGTDPRYGQRTMTWVLANYSLTRDFGQDRSTPSQPAIQIFERTRLIKPSAPN